MAPSMHLNSPFSCIISVSTQRGFLRRIVRSGVSLCGRLCSLLGSLLGGGDFQFNAVYSPSVSIYTHAVYICGWKELRVGEKGRLVLPSRRSDGQSRRVRSANEGTCWRLVRSTSQQLNLISYPGTSDDDGCGGRWGNENSESHTNQRSSSDPINLIMLLVIIRRNILSNIFFFKTYLPVQLRRFIAYLGSEPECWSK